MTKKKTMVAFVANQQKVDRLTKSLMKNFTTIHGISYLDNLGRKSKIVWILLFLSNIIGSIAFLMIIQQRFRSDQIVTKIYSEWTVGKVPFPSVTICNHDLVSRREKSTIEDLLQSHNISQAEIDSLFRDLPYLTNFGWGSALLSNHSAAMGVLKEHYYTITSVMEEIHQKCEDLLVYCEFNSKEKSCKDLFKLIPTCLGFCCSFNFEGLNNDQEEQILDGDNDFDYYYDQGTDDPGVRKTSLIATTQAGRKSGLRVVIDVEPSDYYSMTPTYGARILINDPNDYIETQFSYKLMTIGESMDIKVEPLIFQSEDSLRHVDPAKRDCWFHDEVELTHTSRYSFETCHTECRIDSYLLFCGCVPYKYPPNVEHRTCEFSDLQCLHYMKVNWERTRKQCQPVCRKECRDKEYQVTNDLVPFLATSYPGKVTEGRNISELAGLHVYYVSSTINCYMMTVLTDTNTFVATYGGIFSLTFGASIVTVFELTYLSLAALYKMIRKIYTKKKPTKTNKYHES